MESERGSAMPGRTTFAQALAALKQEGSNILLVGADAAGSHDAVCHRLLGEGECNSRYRVFVTNGDRRSSSHGNQSDVQRSHTIDYSALDRPTGNSPPNTENISLGALGIEIIETIDELCDDANGLEPSELRVCADSLVALLRAHRSETVFQFLHMTTSRISTARGMGHYHLPLDRDHDAVNLFEPLFDAIVEVRSRDDRYEQRWELRDQGLSTEWLPLDSIP